MDKTDKAANKNDKNKTGKKNIEHTVKNLIAETIANLGFELWNVEYYNDNGEWLLEITIDIIENSGKSGISLDDCETVTKAVVPLIDDADPVEHSYSLVVSSPGLNRELKTGAHINKYIGKTVSVKLFAKNEKLSLINADGKNFTGILKEYSDSGGNMTFESCKPPGKSVNKQKSRKNNIINSEGKEDENADYVITLAKKDIAHIYAYDEL